MDFTATILIRDANPYVLMSAARARQLRSGWRRPMPVLVRINGHPTAKPWRINMMPTGSGAFYLYLHGDVRRASKTKVGDRVHVTVDFDQTYRNGPMHPMPSWFRAGLKNKSAGEGWVQCVDTQPQERDPSIPVVAEVA